MTKQNMEKDIYYETPRLPMFMIMEEENLVRVRTLKYVNGKLDSVLADWDANNIQDEFYEKEHWNDEYETPFYCLYRDKNGRIYKNCTDLMYWAEEEAKQWGDRYTAKEIYDSIIAQAEMYGCPIFNSLCEARRYVFQK